MANTECQHQCHHPTLASPPRIRRTVRPHGDTWWVSLLLLRLLLVLFVLMLLLLLLSPSSRSSLQLHTFHLLFLSFFSSVCVCVRVRVFVFWGWLGYCFSFRTRRPCHAGSEHVLPATRGCLVDANTTEQQMLFNIQTKRLSDSAGNRTSGTRNSEQGSETARRQDNTSITIRTVLSKLNP